MRLSAAAPESQIDELLGRTGTPSGLEITAQSSGRLPGDLRSAASFAFDDDPNTAWTGVFGPQADQWLQLDIAEPVHVENLVVDVVADDFHSLPRRILVFTDGEAAGEIVLDGGLRSGARGETLSLVHRLDSMVSSLMLVAADVDERTTRDWYSNAAVAMPISIAEVTLGDGVHFSEASDIDSGCVELLAVNGAAVGVRFAGSAQDALARRELALSGCGEVVSAADGLRIETRSRPLGFDLDQLVLRSPRPIEPPPPMPSVEVLSHDDTSYSLRVPALDNDAWLVLGQSHNDGWSASVDGVDLGDPVLIDGFANGWRLPAGDERSVDLRWTPQRLVDWALWTSLLAVAVVVWLALRGSVRPDVSVARRRDGPELPVLDPIVGFSTSGRRPSAGSARLIVGGAVSALGFALLNLPQWHLAAVGVGAIVAVGVWRPRWWNRPALYSALLLGIAALSIMVDQRRFRYPPDFVWPQQFEGVHVLAVLALVLLFADCLRSAHRPDA